MSHSASAWLDLDFPAHLDLKPPEFETSSLASKFLRIRHLGNPRSILFSQQEEEKAPLFRKFYASSNTFLFPVEENMKQLVNSLFQKKFCIKPFLKNNQSKFLEDKKNSLSIPEKREPVKQNSLLRLLSLAPFHFS